MWQSHCWVIISEREWREAALAYLPALVMWQAGGGQERWGGWCGGGGGGEESSDMSRMDTFPDLGEAGPRGRRGEI